MNNKVAGENKEIATENLQAQLHATEVETANLGNREFGKFSTANDLKNAYDSLEAEFTRRSQRLKELERELEKLKSGEQPKMNSQPNGFSGEEGFFKQNPEAQELKPLLIEIATESKDDAQGFLERAYVTYLKNKLKSAEEEYSSNDYVYKKANESSNVKEEIIKEYLDRVYASKPTARLISGNGGAIIAPPSKPKTLQEANLIAKLILEKAKEIN